MLVFLNHHFDQLSVASYKFKTSGHKSNSQQKFLNSLTIQSTSNANEHVFPGHGQVSSQLNFERQQDPEEQSLGAGREAAEEEWRGKGAL